MSPDGDGWNEWSRHVLAELKRLSNGMEKLDDDLNSLKVTITADIRALQVKAGVWGFIAGAIPSVVAIVWFMVTK